MIERVLTACRDLSPEEAGKLMALLRRFEAEAARDEARHIAGALADEAALAVVMEHAPRALLELDDPETAHRLKARLSRPLSSRTARAGCARRGCGRGRAA